jgi:MraZ protein
MFGEFYHNVDAKGRLSIPSKFRDSLGSTVVISRGPERCLRLFSLEEWEKFVESIEEQLDTSDVRGRYVLRELTGKSSVCDLDSQGRIVITSSLRDFAGITKEVVVIGNGKKAEIWDKAKYEAVYGDDVFDDEQFSAMLAEFKVQI